MNTKQVLANWRNIFKRKSLEDDAEKLASVIRFKLQEMGIDSEKVYPLEISGAEYITLNGPELLVTVKFEYSNYVPKPTVGQNVDVCGAKGMITSIENTEVMVRGTYTNPDDNNIQPWSMLFHLSEFTDDKWKKYEWDLSHINKDD